MYIARILFPVKDLGPGDRLGIWVSGCSRNCPGCANPELHNLEYGRNITIETLDKLFATLPQRPLALTVTGGEPFDQQEELSALCDWFSKNYSRDILVYTGYTLDQLHKRSDLATVKALQSIAALVDGEYIEQLNNGSYIKGSDNQSLFVFRKEYENEYLPLDRPCGEARPVQVFPCAGGGMIATGFEKRNFKVELFAYQKQREDNGG